MNGERSFEQIFHNREKPLMTLLEKVKKSDICECNKQQIADFYTRIDAQHLSPPRKYNYVFYLLKVATQLNRPFKKANKDDIVRVVQFFENSDYSEHTKSGIRMAIKKFYKWLIGNDEEYPKTVKWIKTPIPINKQRLPEHILTSEDIKKMVAVCETIRDKAFIMTLYETGFRVAELCSLKLCNLKFDEYGALITVISGKTGGRTCRIVASAPLLSNWIENHPHKDDPESYLWVGIGTRNHGKEVLTYSGVWSLMNRIGLKLGWSKKTLVEKCDRCKKLGRESCIKCKWKLEVLRSFSPHKARHGRATELASNPNFNDSLMNMNFGWAPGSRMAKVYQHLTPKDVDKATLKMHGLYNENYDKETGLKTIECPRCKMNSSPGAKFCNKCGFCYDAGAIKDFEGKKSWLEQEFQRVYGGDIEAFVEKLVEKKIRDGIKENNVEGD